MTSNPRHFVPRNPSPVPPESRTPVHRPVQLETGYIPHTFQRKVHKRLKRFSVLVCHRRFGKTYLAINTLIDAALRCQKTDGHFAYLAPFFAQAKRVSWQYLVRFTQHIPNIKVNKSELSVTFGHNGAVIRLYGCDNPNALRGIFLDGCVIDEVSDMKPEVWGEVIRPALSDRKGWALFIGTPRGYNMFYELYELALRDPNWYADMFTVEDTVHDHTVAIDEEELAMAKSMMTENQYRQEFLCDFSASCDDTVITIDVVNAAAAKFILDSEYKFAPRVLGVDVARFGDDRSVIQKRQGLASFEPDIYKGVDNMWLAGQVAHIIDEWHPSAVFVDSGRGEGVIDRLRQLGYDNIIEVNFGGKPMDMRYANKRSEMWFNMASWFEDGGCIPRNPELIQSLVAPTYHFSKTTNRILLEAKEDLKTRVGSSPDPADALALTFAMPVHVPTHAHRPQEYDPFAMR